MRVLVTGGTGNVGSYIISELIAAGHEVTGLARSDASAEAVSALGATVRRGELEDVGGLQEAAADSDGVIHVAFSRDVLGSGGLDAVAAAELPVMLAYGEALVGTGKPLGWAGSAVFGRAASHSTTDRAGLFSTLIALAKEKGVVGDPGGGASLWNVVHVRDVASAFRLALEHDGQPGVQPHHVPVPRLGTRSAWFVVRCGQRPLLPRRLTALAHRPSLTQNEE